jgi:hypothetical protein
VAITLWGGRAAAECQSALATQFLPIPIYATLPNEGNTWGFMPVFLRVCPDGPRTESIFAPSLSWNSVIQYTGTFRWFHYPTDDSSLVVVGSASTRINWNALLVWQHLPDRVGASTDELTLRAQRDVFFRYFGLGPDTPFEAQSSYTRLRALASARRGVNVVPHFNLGVAAWFEADGVEATGVPGLPLSPHVFPGAPGMGGATLASQGVELRYDDRRGGDYAERGLRIDAAAGVVEGLSGSPTYLRGAFEARAIIPENGRVSAAARLLWNGVSSGEAPFYLQSSLGGALLMRGYMPDRFIDRQAWTLELEQRFCLFQTHIFGVVADWRVDPFFAVGQVFGPFDEAFSHPRASAGIGFRAFVHPNVLGRVDVAKGLGENLNVYVELGYPY